MILGCKSNITERYKLLFKNLPFHSLDGRGVWRRMDTYICMAESFNCSPKTITTLLIGYDGGLVTELCLTLVTPWTVACQAPLSMGFPRQEYWSGLPFPPPQEDPSGDLPDSGIEPGSSALQADSLPTEPLGKLMAIYQYKVKSIFARYPNTK